jgi:flagellar biosynthesis protein FliQ
MNPALAQDLESIAMIGLVVRPLLVATLLVGLWYALVCAQLAVRQRLLTWSVVAAVLILWLATVWTFAALGLFEHAFERAPGAGTIAQGGIIVAPTVLFVAVALTVLMRSRTIAPAIDAAPLWWLVAYQARGQERTPAADLLQQSRARKKHRKVSKRTRQLREFSPRPFCRPPDELGSEQDDGCQR